MIDKIDSFFTRTRHLGKAQHCSICLFLDFLAYRLEEAERTAYSKNASLPPGDLLPLQLLQRFARFLQIGCHHRCCGRQGPRQGGIPDNLLK